MTQQDKELFKNYGYGGLGNGCGPALMYGLILIGAILLLSSCKSIKSVESTTESHKVSELVEKMDSLVTKTSKWQQDIYQKQTSLVDSFKQKEKNDSSHVIIVNEKGDTVRERIEIHHYVEREHSTDTKESEVWIQKFREVDSLLKVSLDKQAVTDSLLKEHNKETVVEKQLTFWQRIKQSLGGWAILISTVLLLIMLYKIFSFLRRKAL